MNKKAQIKIFENIGVLLIFFVLIVLAIVFYFVFSKGDLEEQRQELGTQNAIELASKISLLPELQCRKDNAQEDHCIDKLKLATLAIRFLEADAKEEYFDILGFSTIKIKLIQLTDSEPKELGTTIYDHKKEGGNTDNFFIPVSVHDPISDQYDYGILEVSVYS